MRFCIWNLNEAKKYFWKKFIFSIKKFHPKISRRNLHPRYPSRVVTPKRDGWVGPPRIAFVRPPFSFLRSFPRGEVKGPLPGARESKPLIRIPRPSSISPCPPPFSSRRVFPRTRLRNFCYFSLSFFIFLSFLLLSAKEPLFIGESSLEKAPAPIFPRNARWGPVLVLYASFLP